MSRTLLSQVNECNRFAMRRHLADRPAAQLRRVTDLQFDYLAFRVALHFEGGESLPRHRRHGQDRGRQQRSAQGEDVVQRSIESVEQVLIEHARTTRTLGLIARTISVVEMLTRSSLVRMSTPRALATSAASRTVLATIAQDQSLAEQTRVVALAAIVDDYHRHVGGMQIFQDACAHAAQTTQDDGTLHDGASSTGASTLMLETQ